MHYVLDTHPIVWFVGASPRLSQAAQAAMSDPSAQLIIPTIVLIEIRFLYARGRVQVDPARVQQDLIGASNCTVYPIDEQVASMTPTGLNIHDAIIVATGLVYRDVFNLPAAVVTCDGEITKSGLIQTIW
jgi:PIN domain nuclease of toxin-antitoxin system